MHTSPDFEPLARGFYLEGLLVEGTDVWFTDVALGGVRRLGSNQVLLEGRTMIGGLLMNADGAVLAGGAGGVAWANPKTGAEGMLLEGLDGVNEMRPDGRGGMVFGVIDLPAILRSERPGPSAIYHLSADRRLTRLCDGLAFANGLAVSADGATLFFNETFAAVRSFPIHADATLGAPRLLIEKPDCDGLALDAQGDLWVTGFASGEVLRLSPDGAEIGRLPLPGAGSTNVRFGGEDMRDLYVNVVDPAAAQALAKGEPIAAQNAVLYRTRSPVAGAPIQRTAFELQ